MHCKDNFDVGLFQDTMGRDNNNIGQYRLDLQIDSLDKNRLCATVKNSTPKPGFVSRIMRSINGGLLYVNI